MLILSVCLLSLLVIYLLFRFAKYVIGVYLILCGVFALSIPIMFYSLELGIDIMLWSALLIICMYLLTIISGFIGALISGLVVAPFLTMWLGIKVMLFKFK